MRDSRGRRRVAAAARNGSFTGRRCPTTLTSNVRALGDGPAVGVGRADWTMAADLGPVLGPKLLDGKALQRYDPRRHVQHGPAALLVERAVDVGAGEQDDDGAAGTAGIELPHGLRAAQRVDGDEEVEILAAVGLADSDAVAEFAEEAGPPAGGDAVAAAASGRRGGRQSDVHDGSARLRRRRCGSRTSRRAGRGCRSSARCCG